MTYAERLERWNGWYDGLPEAWRFQAVLWPLLVVGAINMVLTISMGFPFGFLVLLALLAVAVMRVPHLLGWVQQPSAADAASTAPGAEDAAGPRIRIGAMPWVMDVNRWYDGLPEYRRPWVILVVLAVAGGINMLLTISHGFSFGILFLLALLAIVAIRGPYVAGWLIEPPEPQDRIASAQPREQIAQEVPVVASAPAVSAEGVTVAREAVPPESAIPSSLAEPPRATQTGQSGSPANEAG